MKENKDCKIIQDLLPNYIDGLTDPITNEYIEKHIQTCLECREKLKNMNGEIKLDKIDESREIDYLKKVRNRILRFIAVIVLVMLVLTSGIIYMACNYYVQTDENGNKKLVKNQKIETTNLSYVKIECQQRIEDLSISENGNIIRKAIALIDKDGLVLDIRECISGYTSKGLEQEYQRIKNDSNIFRNVKIIDGKIYFNRIYWKGKSKDQLKDLYSDNYTNVIIQEW